MYSTSHNDPVVSLVILLLLLIKQFKIEIRLAAVSEKKQINVASVSTHARTHTRACMHACRRSHKHPRRDMTMNHHKISCNTYT